jgi:hypothetical protein
MTQEIYAFYRVDKEDRIDPRSEEGKKRHLDLEVTKFILADFPLTDEERERLAAQPLELRGLAGLFLESLNWAEVAEHAAEHWRS